MVEWFGRTSLGADRETAEVLATVARAADELVSRLSAEAQVRTRERQQAAVAGLGRLALQGAPLDVLFNEAVTLLSDTLDVEFAKVLRLLAGGDELLLVAGVRWQNGLVGRATVNMGTDSQAGYTLSVEGPVIVRDLRTEIRFTGPALLTEHGVAAGMSALIGSAMAPGEYSACTRAASGHSRRMTPRSSRALPTSSPPRWSDICANSRRPSCWKPAKRYSRRSTTTRRYVNSRGLRSPRWPTGA